MRSLNILRQGLWASITGGWFYDPHHDLFCNTFHFYSWISLVLIPFLVHLWSKSAWYPWFIYFGLILTAFSLIKAVNLKLHLMFDTSEAIEEQDVDKHRQKKVNSSSDFEDIELQVLNAKEENSSSPVPVTALENDQQTIISRSNATTDATSIQHGGENDVKVEVHRKNSVSSDPTTLVLDVHCEKVADLSAVTSTTSKYAGYSGNDSMSPPAMTSLKSIESEDVEETQRGQRTCLRPPGGRRFSNISNLAFELSCTTTSAPRLQGGGGSLELGFVLEDSITQTISRPSGGLSVRRTLSALETSTGSPCDPSSTASAPQNVGAVNFPTPDEQQSQVQQTNSQIEPPQEMCAGEQFLVDVKTESVNVSCADEDHWTSFFTGAPFQPFVSSNSQNPICNLSQSQCPERNGKTQAEANLAQDVTHELDIPTLHSSSSSTAESAECEATHLLLPLPPRLLPFPTRTISATTYLTECAAPSGNTSTGLGVIPKRRQRSGACQIDEESEEDELVVTSPSGLCNDELNQFTPPKRRKLAARRRRHPAGDPTNSVVLYKRDVVEEEAVTGQQKNANSCYQNRNRRQWRPRRRRRTNVPISTSPTSSDARDNLFSSVDQCTSVQELELSSSFVVPSTSFPWFVSSAAEVGPTQGIGVTNTSTPSALNISSTTRSTRLSLSGSSNPVVLNNSSISLSSALTVSLPEPDSQTVHFRRREMERTERLRVRATRDRDRHNNSTTTSNPTAIDAADYFGSSTLQTLLHNLHTGRSPLQFISASNLGSVGSASGGGTSGERERERHSIARHPFALPHMVDSMNEVLGRVNNNHSEARFRTDTQGSEDEQQSPPILSLTKPRRFYRFYFWPCRPDVGSKRPGSIKVRFDRLALLALLDRNLSSWDSALCVILALAVSILTALVLRSGLLQDACAFLFCLVCAGSQYSLLKSVQPDASSPTHGHNRLVAFSRSVYFILVVSLLLLVDYSCQQNAEQKLSSSHVLSLYGLEWGNFDQLKLTRDMLIYLVLCFPIIFSLGLLPQISTFTIYLLEQIEIHVFSGTAVTGLSSAVYATFRSCFLVVLVYGPAYAGLKEPATSQHILFSAYCGLLVASCYHVSRCSADPSVLCSWVLQLANSKQSKTTMHSKTGLEDDDQVFNKVSSKEEATQNGQKTKEDDAKEVEDDPLPRRMRETVVARLRSDAIICPLVAVLVFGVHCSTVFTTSQLQPVLGEVLWIFSSVLGFILHYIIPQMRKSLPWLCFSRPLMRSHEHDQFEVHQPARLMWFERMFLWLSIVERHVLLPVFFLDVMTRDSPILVAKFGLPIGVLLAVVCGKKGIRASMTNPSSQYLIITFAKLLFGKDLASTGFSETFLVDYFIVSVLLAKTTELFLKIQFIITYIAPWQITWGSAFHAFAQPFSCPHSAMLFCQAIISSLLSAPLSPFLGSAIFFTSYPRPVKFWERDYKTRRVDASNTRLASQLEPTRSPGGDDNNLNSIFYEHLTRSLQQSLAGDLMLGRWGPIAQGDCYVLASENLNCLVHIVECGNSLVTFQVRGLEFRGTYCQQREVEAISEGVEEDDSCCCCEPGHLPYMLGGNAAFNQRWLAWQVMATKYVLEGYSISDNNASTMLHVFDLRRILVTYYIKSLIYYATRSPLLEDWLTNASIVEALQCMSSDRSFADLDPVFNINIDEDYDYHVPGITRSSFCSVYLNWIQYCASRREKSVDSGRESMLVSLCLALSLLGRRALGSAAHTALSNVEFFLFGLHALFKGDFRITSFRDEWVFNDMELLRRVVAPAIRMSLKLHQDHFACPDEYEDPAVLYEAIGGHEAKLVISHEGDPAWRRAVLAGVPSLLALRHVVDDNSDEYKIIMLNKRFLSFRVIKLNRECVRGLWAGQQQELVYLRNRNQERGSIQNAKQVLRNIINSSCDQPIGYPIYVSPLMTSFAETHPQILSTLGGGPISVQAIRSAALLFFRRLRARCGAGCSSGGSGGTQCPDVEISLENLRSNLMAPTPGPTGSLANIAQSNRTLFNAPFGSSFTGSSSGLGPNALALANYTTSTLSAAGGGLTSFTFNTTRGSSPRSSLGASTQRGSIASTMSATLRKPSGSTLISLAGMLAERDSVVAAMSLTASPSSSAQAIASAPMNSTVSVFRERRSSRGSESQDREWDPRLRGALSESGGAYGGPIRQRSSTSRNGEEERRGARERNRRRERDRRESRLDRLESLDGDRALPEAEPFVDNVRIRINQRVKIIDPNQIYDTINLGRRIDVLWPSSGIREKGGKNYWRSWLPEVGDEGVVVHIWTPNHPDTRQRSHVDRVILLLQIEDKYVPISESAVEVIGDHAP